jgi:glucans biosynthesis protein C
MNQPLSNASSTNNGRLFFIDWLRIIAFFVLIFFHVGMYYVTWDFHVKSADASKTIEPLMMLSSPWRLSLLFMISGVASAFMLKKIRSKAFARQRSWRLLIPLVFGMLIIVPPQSYFEVVEKVAYQGSYVDFMKLYLTGYHGFCRDGCLIMPTWNHLWFVAYLWVYSLLIAGLMAVFGQGFERASAWLDRVLVGWKIIVLPLVVLACMRVTMVSQFPSTHALIDDWFNHANYFAVFLLGALLASQSAFWVRVEEGRWLYLSTALSCWGILIVYYALPEAYFPTGKIDFWRDVQRVVYVLCAWCAMLAAFGFAHRHLQFDSPRREYLAQAVFPVYIVHQTLIIMLAHWFKPAKLAPALEGVILIVLTLTLSFGLAEIVRRVAFLRPFFGLAGQPRKHSAAVTAAGEIRETHFLPAQQ